MEWTMLEVQRSFYFQENGNGMPSKVDNLSSAVWYIGCGDEESLNSATASEGSGVAIRLCRLSGNEYPCNYLLTCSHVIRKAVSTGQLGPRYANIRAWPSGSGYNPAAGFALEPVYDALPIQSEARDNFYLQSVPDVPNTDWVLLGFVDAAKSNDMDLSCVEWGEPNLERGTPCHIIGYPGGAAGFRGHNHAKNNTVRASLPYGQQLLEGTGNGVVEFRGSFSRPGMSGGGVFVDETNTFVGLHRDRNDLTQQLHAVSAMQIRKSLEACGYKVVPPDEGKYSRGNTTRPVVLEDLSVHELVAIASTLLKTAITDCYPGACIELSIGQRGKLRLTLGALAADSMQRMALKNDVGLLETQESQIVHLEDLRMTGAGGAMHVGLLIQRAEEAHGKTTNSIRDRLMLMVERLVASA